MKAVIIFILFLASATYGRFVREVSPEARITDGYVASPGDFPYMALIEKKLMDNTQFCAGSIISNEYILTAAKCTRNCIQFPQTDCEYLVHLGSFVFGERIVHKVNQDNLITHPEFNWATTENDIALIKIPFTVYKNSIKPIRLPVITGRYSNSDYLGHKVLVVGWKYPRLDTIVLYIEQYIIKNSACIPYHTKVTNKNICVTTSNFNAPSSGDSGGPLVKPSYGVRDPELLLGIYSCASSEGYTSAKPVIYAEVASYLIWIHQNSGVAYYPEECQT